MMIINAVYLKEKDLSGEFMEYPSMFPVLRESTRKGECRFTDLVTTRFRAMRIKNIIEVEGRVSTKVGLTCSRCLVEFDTPLRTRFALTYAEKKPPEETEESGEEEEETGPDMESMVAGMIPFNGPEIDLREGIQEQIMLALPGRPLCIKGCKGLCPICGIDRNKESCDCKQPPPEHPFDILKGLKI